MKKAKNTYTYLGGRLPQYFRDEVIDFKEMRVYNNRKQSAVQGEITLSDGRVIRSKGGKPTPIFNKCIFQVNTVL